ncbi:MAG: two-component sensor histidine kinase, partial [Roseburia hominis]
MKFKNKIIISFCIIIFIPILLAVAVLFGFQKIQLKSIEQTYGVESDDYSYFSNSMQLLSRFTRESFETLLDLSKQDPDKLEDKAFLEQMNDTLREKYSYLVVRRGDELIYVGDDKEASLLTDLPAYGGEESGADTGIYVDGDKQALIKQIDFVYTDGSQGSVFIITILEETVPELKSLMA